MDNTKDDGRKISPGLQDAIDQTKDAIAKCFENTRKVEASHAQSTIGLADDARKIAEAMRPFIALIEAKENQVNACTTYNVELKNQRDHGIFPPKVDEEWRSKEDSETAMWDAFNAAIASAKDARIALSLAESLPQKIEDLIAANRDAVQWHENAKADLDDAREKTNPPASADPSRTDER
jgi:hypothetical protein